MMTADRIATIYTNARELVRANNPKAARSYVLLLLNSALENYNRSKSILGKAKAAVFLDRWIEVSRQLYDKGITDYVLECFGLASQQAVRKPVHKGRSAGPASLQRPAEPVPQKRPAEHVPEPISDGDIDFSGLIEKTGESQGWCAEVFEQNRAAVAEVYVLGDGQSANGTGFIISPKGYLLTNDHVVYDSVNGGYYPKVTMKLNGEKKRCKLNVLFSDKKADLALCSFDPAEEGEFVSVKRIADYASLMQGADCLVIGNAFGMGLAPFSGVVRFTKDSDGNLVYTAPSNPGDSGAPVFNRKGECIGINKSKTVSVNDEAAEGYANATTMDTIEKLLEKWCACNGIEL